MSREEAITMLLDEAHRLIQELRGQRDSARRALNQIATLRPAGDVDRCANARKLVEQMEAIALANLPTPHPGDQS